MKVKLKYLEAKRLIVVRLNEVLWSTWLFVLETTSFATSGLFSKSDVARTSSSNSVASPLIKGSEPLTISKVFEQGSRRLLGLTNTKRKTRKFKSQDFKFLISKFGSMKFNDCGHIDLLAT